MPILQRDQLVTLCLALVLLFSFMNTSIFFRAMIGPFPEEPAVLLSNSYKLLFPCHMHYARHHSNPKTRETSPQGRWHFLHKEHPLTGIMWTILLIATDSGTLLIVLKALVWFQPSVFASEIARINISVLIDKWCMYEKLAGKLF